MEKNSSKNQSFEDYNKLLSAIKSSVDSGFKSITNDIKELEWKMGHLQEDVETLRDELHSISSHGEENNESSYTDNTPSSIVLKKHNREENIGNTGKQKSVSRNSWIVVGLSVIACVIVIVGLLIYLEPERNAHQIINASSSYIRKTEQLAANALKLWDKDKRAVRNFRRLLCNEDKRDDLKSFFRAMIDSNEVWAVVDHLSVESNWPDAGRVIIVHYINGQGQYRNAIVDSNGNIRNYPGEKGKYYYSYQDIQNAKVLDGI